jgi:hypothetical protein
MGKVITVLYKKNQFYFLEALGLKGGNMGTVTNEGVTFKSFEDFEAYTKKEGIVIGGWLREILPEIDYTVGRQLTTDDLALSEETELRLEEVKSVNVYQAIRAAWSYKLKKLKAVEALSAIIIAKDDCKKDGKKVLAIMYPVIDGPDKVSFIGEWYGDVFYIKAFQNRCEIKNTLFTAIRK